MSFKGNPRKPSITVPSDSFSYNLRPVRGVLKLKIVIVFQMAIIAYLVFSILSMVPRARAHFIDVLLSPSISFLMAQ